MFESSQNNREPSFTSYPNLPKLSEFSQEEFSSHFLQTFYLQKNAFEPIGNPFSLKILKLDTDVLSTDANVTFNLMAFFIHYIRASQGAFQLKRPGYPLGFNVDSYSKLDKTLVFENLETLKNHFKGNKEALLNNKLNLFLVFFYNGRWLLAVYDIKREKCNIIDFLKQGQDQSSNEEAYDLVKVYLKQEFDIKPSSVSFFDKFKRDLSGNCGLSVCKFLAEYFLNSKEYERINFTEGEATEFTKILPWLVRKVDSAGKGSQHGSKQSLLSQKSHRSQRSVQPIQSGESGKNDEHRRISQAGMNEENRRISQVASLRGSIQQKPDAIHYSRKSSRHGSQSEPKVKVTKGELAEMLNRVKAEVIEEMDSEDELSQMLEKEGLFENSLESTEEFSKKDLKKLMQKAQRKKEQEKLQKESGQPTYEEYAKQAEKYYQEAGEFQNMLTFFQNSNPALYQKVAEELNSQMEDKMLGKFNLLHVKYPGVHRSSNRGSQLGMPTLPNSDKHRFSSLQRESLSGKLGSENFSDRQSPKQYTLYSSQGSDFNPLLSGFNKAPRSPSQFSSVGSQEKGLMPFSPKTPSSRSTLTASSQNSQNRSVFFNAGKAAFNNNHDQAQQTQYVAKRYGLKVLRSDYQKLKNENMITTEVMKFYIGYLREKQAYIPLDKVKFYELNIFYFGPEFYDALTNNNPVSPHLYFENVRSWTSKYSTNGKSIFQVFDKIVIFLRMRSDDYYALVYINNIDKKIYLFDPNKPRDNVPSENPILTNILNYIQMEFHDKTKSKLDVKQWQKLYGSISKVSVPRDSGLVVARIANTIQKGNIQGQTSDEQIAQFKTNLLDLILKVGIAENPKEDMRWIVNHPI